MDSIRKKNNRALLLSKYLIIKMVYNDEEEKIEGRMIERKIIDLERSKIRKYLNGEFYNTSFTVNEKSMICDINIENNGELFLLNSERSQYLYDSNYNANATNDKIFILSKDEIVKNFNDGIYDNYNSNRLPKKLESRFINEKNVDSYADLGWWTRTEDIWRKYEMLMGQMYSYDERKVYAVKQYSGSNYLNAKWPSI